MHPYPVLSSGDTLVYVRTTEVRLGTLPEYETTEMVPWVRTAMHSTRFVTTTRHPPTNLFCGKMSLDMAWRVCDPSRSCKRGLPRLAARLCSSHTVNQEATTCRTVSVVVECHNRQSAKNSSQSTLVKYFERWISER